MTLPSVRTSALPLLTSSRIKDARACLRLDHIKYGLSIRAVGPEGEALTLGRLVHLGLEAWWKNLPDLDGAIAAIRGAEADPFAKARAEAMLAGYHIRWGDVAAQWYEVLAVEVEFAAPLLNPESGAASRSFQLAGRIDAVVRERASGRTLLVEHKTASEDITPGSIYWRRLRMDGQVSIYYAGARTALGYDVSGCLYDVLAKPGQRPLQANTKRAEPETPEQFRDRLIETIASTPDAFYARGEVARLGEDLVDAEADRWAIAQLLRDNARISRHPKNPDSCLRYGRVCDFFAACSGEAQLDDPTHFVRVDNPHPELSGASKEETRCQSQPQQ